MKENIKNAIKTSLGNADAPSFIKLLESAGSSENIDRYDRGFTFQLRILKILTHFKAS